MPGCMPTRPQPWPHQKSSDHRRSTRRHRIPAGLFYLASFALSSCGLSIPLVWDGGWANIVLSLLVVVAASLNLVLDFDLIERGVGGGVPVFMSWHAAFALIVTVIWLYLEMLRLLPLIRSRR